jgi:hypothetical protein
MHRQDDERGELARSTRHSFRPKRLDERCAPNSNGVLNASGIWQLILAENVRARRLRRDPSRT